jgi:hypothetical protein
MDENARRRAVNHLEAARLEIAQARAAIEDCYMYAQTNALACCTRALGAVKDAARLVDAAARPSGEEGEEG